MAKLKQRQGVSDKLHLYADPHPLSLMQVNANTLPQPRQLGNLSAVEPCVVPAGVGTAALPAKLEIKRAP